MEQTAKKLRHRLSRKPAEGRKIPSVSITHRDIHVIFKLLSEIRYLTTDYIHAFTGGDYDSLRKHLEKLYLNGYVNRPKAQHDTGNANYLYCTYELDRKGAEELAKHGYTVPTLRHYTRFEHKYLECLFEASLRLGIIERPSVKMIGWPAIIASDGFPPATRKARNPIAIPLSRTEEIIPDGKPFVLSYDERKFLFCVYEADCDTESNYSEAHNTIRHKVASYLHILKDKIHFDHYGATTFMVLFLTTNEGRQTQILSAIETGIKELRYPPELAKRIAVKFTPTFNTPERPVPASGHILTAPWKRACGHPDFQLDQPA